MIKCKYRTILLFLLLIIYLNEVGTRRNRNTRRKATCTKPDKVSNAGLKKRYERKLKFKDGDKVEYNCQPGYTMEGTTRKRWCRKGKWTGVGFSCNPDHPYRQSALNQDLKVYGDISIDQILAKANNKENVGEIASGLMELDIIVDKSVKTPSSYRANINKDGTRRWHRDIPYEIDDEMSLVQKIAILRAIPVWQKFSCLNFYESKQEYHRIWFKLVKDNVCRSYVGMNQGLQPIYLGATCFETEIIVHEIGHALGFYHEHNRLDRDDYIKIHYKNIEAGKKENFQKQENADFDTNYDYLSIMHYGQYFFSKNESANLITIETMNDTFQSKIGKAKHPSFQDYKTLNAMYKCADRCAKVECPEAGFLGEHCKCYCKGNPDDTSVRLCVKKGECPRPIVNKYLFDIMGKDKEISVSMNRTLFPDKTVLNLVSTNWNCKSVHQLRCEDGIWKNSSITECPVKLDIALTGKTEGVVKVKLNGYYDGYICDDDWDDNDATVACKMLGYTNSLASFLKPQEVDESLPFLLDNVQCSGNESSLAECKQNEWGNHNCRYSEVVTVKCSNSSLPYHIDKTECGIIKLSNSKRKKRRIKVSGGLETRKGMHPWQVGIQRKIKNRWIHWCGGTIINDKWILSAAHCFDDFEERKYNAKLNLKDLRVIVGVHDLTKHDEYEDIFYIEYIAKHWDYSEFKRSYAINDIVLLKLKSYIVFNDFKQPACLPESSDLSETKCEVSGWGKEKENGNITDTLRAAQVAIIKEHDCRLTLVKDYPIDFGKVICAGDDGADTCEGDSGGPLICEINGKSTIIGITSWGKGCGRKEAPGVYTKVSEYLKWINNQISNHHVEEAYCAIDEFHCGLGVCIPESQVCDKVSQCEDSSDEFNCDCYDNFQCGDGKCIDISMVCDGSIDCIEDEEDELNCSITDDPCTESPCKNGATCTSQSGSYTCTCTSQFAGTNCEQSCPNGWNLSSGRCYIFKYAAVNWSTAKRKCDDESGTLAQVDSEAVNNYLHTLRSNKGHETVEAWIGLGDAETENTFKWDGSQQLATYTNWITNEPNNGARPADENCVELKANKKWNDDFCSDKKSYFCERSFTKSCPSGWNLSSGRCYIFKNAAVNWSTAKRKCSLEGGTLAQVDSEAVNNFLNTLMRKEGHETLKAWIGLSDTETENIFKWDGSQQRATYTNWNTNEPNNGQVHAVEHCVEMTASKKWNDNTCSGEKSYFCERSPTIAS